MTLQTIEAPRPERVAAMCARFVAACREHGVRLTATRLAVYRALAADPGHPTAERVHEELRAAHPGLSLPSVYRILEALESAGLIRRVSRTNAAARFDANLEPHQHLVCRECGAIFDVAFPALAETAPRVAGFEIETVDVRLVGRCASCLGTARARARHRRPAH